MTHDNRVAPRGLRRGLFPYVAALVGAQLAGVVLGWGFGLVCHGVLLVVLLRRVVLLDAAPQARMLLVLALCPLARILSLATPTDDFPPVMRYAVVGAPLLIAIMLAVRLLGLSTAQLGLGRTAWLPQCVIALLGVPLGVVAFWLVRPAPLLVTPEPVVLVLAVVVLFVCVGYVEELIFRALLLQTAYKLVGRRAIIWSSAAFAAMYLGTPLRFVAFIALVGLGWAWCVYRTGSTWGVIVAHALMITGMLCVWPFVWP